MMRNEMIAGLLGAALLVSPVAAHAQMPQGKMMDGRVFVSVRFVAEQMKAAISWNPSTRTATVTKDGKIFEAQVGPYVRMLNEHVYVQFREISNAFFEAQPNIRWDKQHLAASNGTITVSLAPLSSDEAATVVVRAVSAKLKGSDLKESQQFLQEAKANKQLNTDLAYMGYEKVVVKLFGDDYGNGDKREYYTYSLTATLVKSGHDWVATTMKWKKELVTGHY